MWREHSLVLVLQRVLGRCPEIHSHSTDLDLDVDLFGAVNCLDCVPNDHVIASVSARLVIGKIVLFFYYDHVITSSDKNCYFFDVLNELADDTDSRDIFNFLFEPVKADTVPFGFWRKSLFDQMGMFDEEMTRNQDDEFNARTIQNGGHIYLVPGICIRYFARDTLAKTWGMFYQYGLFKPLVNKKIKHPATVRQFVPLLFVISLLIGLPLACLFPMVRIIYLTIIALYIVLLGFEGLKYKNAYLPPVFATIHIGYGLGYLHGIVKVLCKRPFYVETNR